MNWNDFLYFDAESPTYLRWKIDILRWGKEVHIPKGTVAGCMSIKDGTQRASVLVQYKGKLYQAHRILWEMFNGPIPEGLVIDHIDGDTWNNSLSNLRVVTSKINSQNQKKRSTNTSGVTGVRWYTQGGKRLYARAAVMFNGVKVEKFFSVAKLGKENAFNAATEWRRDKIEELNNLGNDYTERHGK